MACLNISKVAVGCASIEALRRRQASRVADGVVPIRTRFLPKRADELIGGSIYWIVKHRITVRQTILGFGRDEEENKTIIRLDPALIAVRAKAKRAHQGWRYLSAEDAPQDFSGGGEGLAELPSTLVSELTALALL